MDVSYFRNDQAFILNPGLGDRLLCTATDDMIESFTPIEDGKEFAGNFIFTSK